MEEVMRSVRNGRTPRTKTRVRRNISNRNANG
jgi:hypothetical protein